MMHRRQFIAWTSLLGLSPYLEAKENIEFRKSFQKVEKTIMAVQNHMFPKESSLPSAESMNVTKFLFESMLHKSFDKDIRLFVLEGAEELMLREKGKFTSMTDNQKEKALRSYEETNYGSTWLSRIMTLSIEGLFSDPIYGANHKEAGWKSVKAYGGFPRPQEQYLGL